jgi:fatty acid desaturase
MMAQHASAAALRNPEPALELTPARPGIDELSPSALYRRFKPLFRPRPIIYWSDMLACAVVGWAGFAAFLWASPLSPLGLAGLVLAVVGLYRAALFIHEISHLKHGVIDGFETGWNLLVGIPLLVPSLMYTGTHADHHRRSQYATDEDPEYEAFASWDPIRIAASFLTMLVVPLMLLLRWGIAGPLSYLCPPLRRFLVARASTLVINPNYRRRQLKRAEAWDWAWQEALLAAWIWGVVWAVASGHIPLDWIARWYALPAGVLLLNHLRTLAAHRYANTARVALDRTGQLLDSVNLTGTSWLTPLAAPVGLRYHALHHLLPALPYHSLGQVHRALERELPADSPYRQTALQGVLAGLTGLFAQARRNGARERAYTSRVRYSAAPPNPKTAYGPQAASNGGRVPVWPAETDNAVADQ